MAQISNITLPDGINYNLKGSIYTVIGTQTTTTAAWTGALNTVDALYDGLTIMYFLPTTSKTNVTLNLTLKNNVTTGAINCYYKTNTRLGTHYAAGDMVLLTYWSAGSISVSGTATTTDRWIAHGQYTIANTNYVPAIYISTAAKTAAKVGTLTGESWSGLANNMYAIVDNYYDNTASAALTLNANSHGAKPIYINGEPSSATNHTLPRGMYIVYYNGTYWDFRTDGTMPLTGIPVDRGISIVDNKIGHSNSIIAQDTQAVYPIKIDAQGHISEYGTAITPLTSSSSLDASKLTGTVPTSVLPSYVDDVLEYAAKANFPAMGEEGKIYVDKTTNLTWRWGGSAYVEISPSLAIGSTASTASAGNHTHTVTATGNITLKTAGSTNNTLKPVTAKTVVTGITKKTVVTGGTTTSIPAINITEKTIPNITSVGSTPTLGTQFTIPNISVTSKSIPNVTSVGSAPTLGTAFTVPNVTNAGTAASATVADGTLTIINGSAPTLGTAFTIPNVTSVGSAPTLGTAISVGSASAGTAFKVPNVTSVGSTPTLGTPITVGSASQQLDGVGEPISINAYTALTTEDSVDFTTGDSVTLGNAVTVKTGDAAYTFTGTSTTTSVPV